jgi:DNA polymerase I
MDNDGVIVRTLDGVRSIVRQMIPEPIYAIDTETTGLDPHTDMLTIIAIATPRQSWAIDCTVLAIEDVINTLKPILLSDYKLKLLQNATFDWKWFYRYNIALSHMYDTMVAERILTSGLLRPGFGLDALADRYLGVTLDKSIRADFIGGKVTLTDAHFYYAMSDVKHLFKIRELQLEKAMRHDLMQIFSLEMALLPCTALMEYTGIGVNRAKLESLIGPFTRLADVANSALQDLFINNGAAEQILIDDNGYMAVNTASKPQTIAALHSLGVDVPSLNAKEVLRWDFQNSRKDDDTDYLTFFGIDEDADDVSLAIAQYTGLNNPYLRALAFVTAARKILSSYIYGLLDKINPKTNRIHGWFSQLGARSTGRYSSDLQQIPNDLKLKRLSINESIRGCFESAPNKSFLIADYSAIELVILADLSGDTRLGNEVLHGDVHIVVVKDALTALTPLAYDITPQNKDTEPFKSLRQAAKRVSYATAYGVTGVSLSEQLTIDLALLNIKVTRDEADLILDNWKTRAFPDAGKFLKQSSMQALSKGFTTSALGRKRFYDLEYAAENKWKRLAIGREGSNHPIQSTSADMTKLAMLELYETLDPNRGRIVLTVHDELVTEVDDDYVTEASILKQRAMENAARKVMPNMGHAVSVKVKVSKRYDK